MAEVASVTVKANNDEIVCSIRGIRLPPERTTSQQVADLFVVLASSGAATSNFSLTPGDVVLIRTNPGRDPERHSLHEAFLQLMMIAEDHGIQVVNRPGGLYDGNRFADTDFTEVIVRQLLQP